MKHLKLFEAKNDTIWAVIHISSDDPFDNHSIFILDDRESARDFYIDYVNEQRKYSSSRENMNNDILTEEEADEWVEKAEYEFIEYTALTSEGKFELSEEMKRKLAERKYNL